MSNLAAAAAGGASLAGSILDYQSDKKLSKDEVLKNIDKLKKDLFNFRFQKINSQITDPSKIGQTKKTIARLKTTLKGKLNA